MRIKVIGQKGNGPVQQRTVSIKEFFRFWGPYAEILIAQAQDKTLLIEGHKIKVEIIP